jgi:hypothetical protein
LSESYSPLSAALVVMGTPEIMNTTFEVLISYFAQENVCVSEISRITNIPRQTVWDHYQKFKKDVPFEEIRQKGRPRKLNNSDSVYLGQS